MLSTSSSPDYNFTVTQSKSIIILLKPDSENASPDFPSALSTYVPTVTGINHLNLSLSDFS